ncbi:MAG: GNAT family N-acetyltransferase [Deltaproteobacteria bacterium]|nr:GNAT family N-acetyltransferase [Deltaproteobacteria bacterium]
MRFWFPEGPYLVKTLDTQDEMEAAFSLRHEVFCNELKWVPPSSDERERDSYDGFAQSIGVFDEDGEIVGNVRLVAAPDTFMVEKEFACLLPDNTELLKTADMAEVTRLCVKKTTRNKKQATTSPNISLLLYRGIYQWSLYNDIRHLTMVVEKNKYRLLRLACLPVKALDSFKEMNGGVMAGALLLDLRHFEKEAEKKKPDFISWMSRQAYHNPSQERRHGLYSPH